MADWQTVGAVGAAFGGFTGLGALIDLALYKSEKAQLKAWLEDQWLRFSLMSWGNFGRKEAEAVVRFIDRHAGRSVFSPRRWALVLAVSAIAFVVAVSWATWCVYAALPAGSPLAPSWTHTAGVLVERAPFPLVSIVVASVLSLSLTRAISVVAARLSSSPLRTIVVFAALLVLQVLVFVFWTSFLFPVVVTALYAILRYLIDPIGMAVWTSIALMRQEWIELAWGDNPLRNLFVFPTPGTLPQWLSRPDVPADMIDKLVGPVALGTFSKILNLLANLPRIAFALVFLLSFAFRPLIQAPVTRLWYGAMDSGRPVFTLLGGAIGTLVAVGQLLLRD